MPTPSLKINPQSKPIQIGPTKDSPYLFEYFLFLSVARVLNSRELLIIKPTAGEPN